MKEAFSLLADPAAMAAAMTKDPMADGIEHHRTWSGPRFVVVAAKVPRRCIVRCQMLTYPEHSFTGVAPDPWAKARREGAALVRQVVGSLDPEVSWTWCDYGAPPSYAQVEEQPPVGLFRYEFTGEPVEYATSTWAPDTYSRTGERVTDVEWPRGWIR